VTEKARRDRVGPGQAWLSHEAVPVFPTLTVATPRLQVRPLVGEDAAAVAEIFADKQTQRWLPVPTEPGSFASERSSAAIPARLASSAERSDAAGFADAAAWSTELAEQRRASGHGDHYGVIRREDETLVGCLWTAHTDWIAKITEVAYAVAPAARGFGLAAEAVDGLAIALLLEHGFQRVELRVAPGNTASRRVAEKAGFTYEGLLRNAGHVHSGRVDLEVWSLVTADLR
jgi:RimJ/RimL family protein N-acetyltransferase